MYKKYIKNYQGAISFSSAFRVESRCFPEAGSVETKLNVGGNPCAVITSNKRLCAICRSVVSIGHKMTKISETLKKSSVEIIEVVSGQKKV